MLPDLSFSVSVSLTCKSHDLSSLPSTWLLGHFAAVIPNLMICCFVMCIFQKMNLCMSHQTNGELASDSFPCRSSFTPALAVLVSRFICKVDVTFQLMQTIAQRGPRPGREWHAVTCRSNKYSQRVIHREERLLINALRCLWIGWRPLRWHASKKSVRANWNHLKITGSTLCLWIPTCQPVLKK